MIPTKEQLAMRLLGTVLMLTGLGVGMNELDRLAESKHVQEAAKQAVELIKQPERVFQGQQSQSQPITADRLIQNPIQYELPKPITWREICQYYPDMQRCLEMKEKQEIAKKGEEKDEKKQN